MVHAHFHGHTANPLHVDALSVSPGLHFLVLGEDRGFLLGRQFPVGDCLIKSIGETILHIFEQLLFVLSMLFVKKGCDFINIEIESRSKSLSEIR